MNRIQPAPLLLRLSVLSLPWMASTAWAGCPTGLTPSAPDGRYVISQRVPGESDVSDLRTGLIWKQCAEGQSVVGGVCTGTPTPMSWQDALAAARNSRYAGASDWRLPNPRELMSLVETACFSPSINRTFFPATPATQFWSAGSVLGLASEAWTIDFFDGRLNSDNKNAQHKVRLVRAGQPQAGFAATDSTVRVGVATRDGNCSSVAPKPDAAGRFLIYQSCADNLSANVKGSGPRRDRIFRLDQQTGVSVPVSVNQDGSALGGDAREAAVSANGHLVVFVAADAAVTKLLGESKAAAEQRSKGGTWGVFMRNMLTNSTQRVGNALTGGTGTVPQLAPDGSAVVFTATNTDPALGAVGQDNVFRAVLTTSGNERVPQPPECVSCKSVSPMGAPVADSNGASRAPVVSADGRYVAYETTAKNTLAAAPSPCPGNSAEVILRDMLTGASQRMAPPPGWPASACGSSGSGSPSIDFSGTVVAFQSDLPLKPGDANLGKDIFTISIGSGAINRISESASGADGNGESSQPVIAGDGKTVAFVSAATNLDTSFDDTNGRADVHAKRRDERVGPLRLSLSPSGAQANEDAQRPALSFNAGLLVFDSMASNLVNNDTNAAADVFRRPVPVNENLVFAQSFE